MLPFRYDADAADTVEAVVNAVEAVADDPRLLAELLDALPVGVALQDADGRVCFVNRMMAEVAGRPASVLLGHAPFALLGGSAVRAERLRRDFHARFASGEARVNEFTLPVAPRARTLVVSSRRASFGGAPMMLSTALDITERKQLERDLARRAFHDDLTGLPSNALMQEIVGAAVRQHQRGGHFALAFIDLDNFKQINDYYSHAIGDELLKAVANRIGQLIRSGDTLSRISGDEFLLLVDPIGDAQDLPPLLDRLIQALKQPFQIRGHQLLTSASIGASVYPMHGSTYETLRRNADSAIVRAKRERKGSAAYFDESMGRALTARMETEQRLRTAVRERRFRAAFQPKVRLATGEVDGFEALIRWVDHDGRVLAPGAFIPLATELGLLDELTGFVVDDVTRYLPTLRDRFGAYCSVSINISALQAGDERFMTGLIERLKASGAARHIVIELTEDALLSTQHFQHAVLPRLREAGIRISIDDFGTGYSSLSMLADLTADEVKVDRAFITAIQERPRSQGILRAVESLCLVLGIEVVAEGVETEAEYAYLRDQSSITMAQGYWFSPPQFIETLLLDERLRAASPPAS